jgi:hypothetical protein
MSVLGWSTTAMASRYTHVVTPIHSDLASRLDGLLWSAETHQSGPIETTAKNAGGKLAARAGVWPGLAVAAGFEPAEGCPSRAFEFCGLWFRPVRLGLVAPEPRLGNPLRTLLNLRE